MVFLTIGCTRAVVDIPSSFTPTVSVNAGTIDLSATEIADQEPLLRPTATLTPTWLLSIDEPTITVSETFATAMIATHPYSTELLYYPEPFVAIEGWFTQTIVADNESWQSNYVTSTNETFRAFTVCDLDLCQERILIENLETEQIHEFDFSARAVWRPISHLRWLDANTLLFDQWSQPHYGFEFAVDVYKQELVLYVVVTDECFVYQKCR